ncbi:MAG: arylsulfatase, partial [Gammaproteobacteria bacterium]|nr:arylsulfatase [Gammaproteobacteria bacterium]
AQIRGTDETLGYELAGNAALFGGDLKLVRNLPPIGDGQWRLFDIARDPGETRDLRSARPEDFRRLLEAYQKFEIEDGVQALPEGYTPQSQVSLNALRRVILPQLIWPATIIAVFTILWLLLRRRRRPA